MYVWKTALCCSGRRVVSRTEYNLQYVHGSRGTSLANSVTGIRGRTVKVHYIHFVVRVESELRAVRVVALLCFSTALVCDGRERDGWGVGTDVDGDGPKHRVASSTLPLFSPTRWMNIFNEIRSVYSRGIQLLFLISSINKNPTERWHLATFQRSTEQNTIDWNLYKNKNNEL